MTLPTNRIYSEVPEFSSFEEVREYLQNQKVEIEDAYQSQTQNINGFFRNQNDEDGSQWVPTIEGSTTAGDITYTQRGAQVLRTGILVDYWFTIHWSAIGGGAGDIEVPLPYPANYGFFNGVLQSGSNLTFPGGRTFPWIQIIGRTDKGTIGCGGSGTGSTRVPMQATGYIAGHIRYIGIDDE
jgi:hypothetical protein